MSVAVDRRIAAVDRLRRLVPLATEPAKLEAWVNWIEAETERIRARWGENDAVREEESQELLAAVAEWIEADQAAVLRPGEDAHSLAERQAAAEEQLRHVYAKIAAANSHSVDNSATENGIQKGIQPGGEAPHQ